MAQYKFLIVSKKTGDVLGTNNPQDLDEYASKGEWLLIQPDANQYSKDAETMAEIPHVGDFNG